MNTIRLFSFLCLLVTFGCTTPSRPGIHGDWTLGNSGHVVSGDVITLSASGESLYKKVTLV